MGKIKEQLAGVAALIGVLAAIGGGFIKYGEIMTKLDSIQNVDTTGIEISIAELEVKVSKLENTDTSHTHEVGEHDHEHSHTKTLVNEKQIQLLQNQIDELKLSSSNPLAN